MRSSASPQVALRRASVLAGVRKPKFRPKLEHLEDRLTPAGIDPVLEWNAIALQANAIDHTLPGGTQKGPVLSARALAIQSVAVYDAVNSIIPQWRQYITTAPNAKGASLDAAVAKASHDVLAAVYPQLISMFDGCLQQTLNRVPNGPAENRGIAVGRFVAQKVIAARANDRAYDVVPYTPGTNPGDWQPDPLHPTQTAIGPGAGNITPFAIRSAAAFRIPAPPTLNSPEYATTYQEVKMLGGDGVTTPTLRTAEQTLIGTFWGYDGTAGLGTPPRLYNQIVRTVATQMGNAAPANARLFALVNVAMTDAGIACWDSKYLYNFWRPVTAVRGGDTDGNTFTTGDANWSPLGAPNDNGGGTNFTPAFPAYASGHATFGAATFRILHDFYGRDRIPFTIGSDEYNGVTRDQNGVVRPVVFRTYTSFSQASEENGQSRIYLGIHWSFDKVQGMRQGNAIADSVFLRAFQPIRGQRLPARETVVGAGRGGVASAVLATTDADFLAGALTQAAGGTGRIAPASAAHFWNQATAATQPDSSLLGFTRVTASAAGTRQESATPATTGGQSAVDAALDGFVEWRG